MNIYKLFSDHDITNKYWGIKPANDGVDQPQKWGVS